jgi:PAS domain-containing protein
MMKDTGSTPGDKPSEGQPPRESARLAWVTLLLAAVLYQAWWPIFAHLVPGAVDPASERVGLMAMCALFLGLSALPRYRRYVVRLSHVALYITTLHFFSLLWRNHLAQVYVAAAFVFQAAVTLSFVTFRALIGYSVAVVGMAVAVAVGVGLGNDAALLLVAGVVTTQAMLATLSGRNLALQRDARRNIRDARNFLGAIIDAIPDPVFVLDEQRRCLLINEAMSGVAGAPRADRASPGASSGLLAALADDLPVALEAARPVQREIPLAREGEPPGTGLAKLSGGQLGAGTRGIIGVIRDITERKALEESLEGKIRELQEARAKVSQLQGLLPICMHCGRIRNEGEWQDLELYVESHTSAKFSHGLCTSCLAEHYP